MSNGAHVDYAEVYRELDSKANEYRGLANNALSKWQSECEHDVVEAVDCGDAWFSSYDEIRVCRKCGYAEFCRAYVRLGGCGAMIPRVTWNEAMRIRRIAT